MPTLPPPHLILLCDLPQPSVPHLWPLALASPMLRDQGPFLQIPSPSGSPELPGGAPTSLVPRPTIRGLNDLG